MARVVGPARSLATARATATAKPTGDPAVAAGDPAVAAGDPAVAASDPAVAASDPAVAASDPAVAAGDPAVAAGGTPLARLRLTLAPDGAGRLDLTATTAAVDAGAVFPAVDRAPALVPVAVRGGLGAHKWADRRLLEGVLRELAAGGRIAARGGVASHPPGDPAATPAVVALIVDSDGSVLEADRANVFAVRDGALVTPPLDGRILPGIARARTIEVAGELEIAVREQPLTIADLDAADELFLTGSVRGIEPLRPARAEAPVTARLAAALRARWR